MYVFSYSIPGGYLRLVPRPWWRIFDRDRIERVDTLERRVVHLTEAEGLRLIVLLNGHVGELQPLIARLLGGATNMQLENGPPAPAYVRVEGR